MTYYKDIIQVCSILLGIEENRHCFVDRSSNPDYWFCHLSKFHGRREERLGWDWDSPQHPVVPLMSSYVFLSDSLCLLPLHCRNLILKLQSFYSSRNMFDHSRMTHEMEFIYTASWKTAQNCTLILSLVGLWCIVSEMVLNDSLERG